jgi:hypothetical protein
VEREGEETRNAKTVKVLQKIKRRIGKGGKMTKNRRIKNEEGRERRE